MHIISKVVLPTFLHCRNGLSSSIVVNKISILTIVLTHYYIHKYVTTHKEQTWGMTPLTCWVNTSRKCWGNANMAAGWTNIRDVRSTSCFQQLIKYLLHTVSWRLCSITNILQVMFCFCFWFDELLVCLLTR